MTGATPDTGWAWSQVAVRALVVLGPVFALVAAAPAGHRPSWWLVAAVLALSGASAWVPDSPFGVTPFLVVLGWWALGLGEALSGWVLLATAALVVAHLAGVLASYGPATMPLDGAVVRLWCRRGALVLLTVPAAWLMARLLHGEPEQPGIWLLGVAVACVAMIAGSVGLAARGEGVRR